MFLGTRFSVQKSRTVTLNIEGITTQDLWIDGKKAKVMEQIRGGKGTLTTQVEAGTHRLIIRLDGRQPMPSNFTVQSDDVNFTAN